MADLSASNYIIPNFLTLTAMMSYIQNACVDTMKDLTIYAQRLMYLLAGIDLVAAVLLNIDEADHLKLLVKKVLKYGFFIYLIANYNSLLNIMLKGFMFFGKMVGSHTLQSVTETIVTNPAAIGTYGIYLVSDALNEIITQTTANITSDPVLLMNIGILLSVAASYFIVGISLFLLYVEFYILGALSIILVPFGVNQYTSFISQKVLNAMISIGIKLMVMVFIIGLMMPFMLTLQPLTSGILKDNTNNLQQNLYLLLPCLAMAFLVIQGPNMAMTLLSGSSSFNASTAVSSLSGMGRAPSTIKQFMSTEKPSGDPKDPKSSGGSNIPSPITGISQNGGYDYQNSNLKSQNMVDKYSGNSQKS